MQQCNCNKSKLTFQMVLQSNITHTPHALQVFVYGQLNAASVADELKKPKPNLVLGLKWKKRNKTNQRNSSTSSATDFKLCLLLLLWLHSSDGESCCCYCCISCCFCCYCWLSCCYCPLMKNARKSMKFVVKFAVDLRSSTRQLTRHIGSFSS